HKILSPFLANMAISSSSGGVWYEGDSTQATFRWKSYLISQSGTDINFAIRLFPSGKIEIFYGDMIYDMVSEVIYGGISKGDSYNYYLRTVSNPGNVWPNMKIELLPRVYPDEMELTTDGYYVGTPAQAYPPTQLKIRVTDNVGLYHEREILFFTDGDYGLVLNEIIVESGNDEQIDYNETAHLDISIISVDTINITNSNFYISCSDPYISLVDSSETLSQITSLSTVLLQDAFSFNVSSDIPNEHLLSFEITVFSDNDTTIIPFELTAYSPVFAIEQIHILDGNNHILEPGETTYISAYIKNKGGSTAENLQFFLSTYDPYIDVIIPNSSLSVLNSGETDSIVFNLSAFNNTPNGHNANFMIDISANNLYPTSDIFSLQIGNLTEGWESTSNLLNWQYGNSLLWFVTDTTSWEGSNSLQSGAITHNQDSWFSIDGIVLTAGNISFYRKVSCEDDQNDNYDYLAFYIDNTEMERWDGEVDWSKLEYPVSAGMHTFKWNYHKDLSVDDGSDCAWVDLIELPQMDIDYGSMALALNTNDNEFCSGDSSQLLSFVDGLNQANFNYSWWPAAGLSNSAIPNPIAYPDTSTEYFLTIFDSNDTVSSSILITVNPVPEAPLVWADSLALHCSPNFEHQWYNMQGLIMGAIDSIYIPYASGDFYVIVNNEFQCFSEASNPFHFTHIGIVEIEDGFDIEIYPNPNNGSFYIELPEYKSEEIFLKIFDTGGKLLMDEIYNKSFINIKIPDAGQGIYFLQIKSENKIVNAKLIVL
ncbi:MAG: T9SS type A sorting domain-containing protein, partial [Bacteroidota bacterium]|nr:T9SS type A sorting domain-containing protein [Bacteroidota bacterium]